MAFRRFTVLFKVPSPTGTKAVRRSVASSRRPLLLVAHTSPSPRERIGSHTYQHCEVWSPRTVCANRVLVLVTSRRSIYLDVMEKWGYNAKNGPDSWAKNFPDANGERQSPINIVRNRATFDQDLKDKPLKISYKAERTMSVENNGHTVKATCKEPSTLTGGPLGNNEYRLVQFHLHWGSNNKQGSEHTVDGKAYPAELHLVHWNATKYRKFEDAVNKSDGLAVLGVFLKVGEKPHPGFQPVCCQIDSITHKGNCCHLSGDYDPASLLPENTERYWTYPGSLTTPPCYESVTWIVFEDVLEVSEEQMQALRTMKFSGDEDIPMVDNYRPPLYIGKRTVRASFSR